MSEIFARQLLAQAEFLARKERRRPQQASLRRAVSAAYYGLFHFLIDQGCRAFLGATRHDRNLRQVMARAFQHREMRDASRTFAGGTLPDWLRTILPTLTIPADLRYVARMFIKLQEERQRADYDLANPLTRAETLQLINAARAAMARWTAIKPDEAARLYLLCLLSWNTLKGR